MHRRDRTSRARRRARYSPATVPLRLHDLRTDPRPELLERFYDGLLQPSFAADELDPLDVMSAALATSGDPLVLAVLAVEGDTVVGGVVGEHYRRSGVLLLAYVVVDAPRRGRGIGSWLMTEVVPSWCAEHGAPLAVGEMHDPRHYRTEEGQRASDRLRFFERLGGRVLAMPFVQPALAGGRRVPHMLLVTVHVSPAAIAVDSSSPALEPAPLRGFLRDYYAAAEGAVPLRIDAQYRLLESHLDKPVPLLSIADFARVPGGH